MSPSPRLDISILIVDDEPTLRESLANLFRDEGFFVRTAEDGLEALLLQRQTPADLILSDVNMPLVEGPDLIAELREAGDRTPVVLMSAANLPVCDLPGVRSLAKPFDLETVLALVTEVVPVPASANGARRFAEADVVIQLTHGKMRTDALRAQAERCYDQLFRAWTAVESARRLLKECQGDGRIYSADGGGASYRLTA
jgi:DNA-binding response OmpR family regulator